MATTPNLIEYQWASIDQAIFTNKKFQAIRKIREYTGVGMHSALEIMFERYKQLRLEHGQDFVCDDSAYWQGCYS